MQSFLAWIYIFFPFSIILCTYFCRHSICGFFKTYLCIWKKVRVSFSHSFMSDSFRLPGLWPVRLLYGWDFRARTLEWVLISSSRGPPDPGIKPASPAMAGGRFTTEPPGKPRNTHQFSSVQSLSHVRLFAIPWTAAHQASLSITNSGSLLKLMSIESVMPSNCHPVCCPLLLPSIFPNIRVFSNESALHIRCPNYWSFSFSISPSNEYSGLISFRMNWFDLLAVQGTLKSRLQCRSSKASILQHSAFSRVQLSHPYMTTGKIMALTRWTFVDKVISLLFNMLSRLVITFLPRSKHRYWALNSADQC